MNAAKWLFAAIVVVVIALGGYVVYQNNNRIVVSSAIPEISASLNNRKYLEIKLNEAGFWKKGNVTMYQGVFGTTVDVRRLDVRIVKQPQLWGRQVDDPNSANPKVYRSFGEQYNPVSKTLFILLQADAPDLSPNDLNRVYSAELLTAIYHVTHTTGNEKNRFDGINAFLKDYTSGTINDGDVILTIQ